MKLILNLEKQFFVMGWGEVLGHIIKAEINFVGHKLK